MPAQPSSPLPSSCRRAVLPALLASALVLLLGACTAPGPDDAARVEPVVEEAVAEMGEAADPSSEDAEDGRPAGAEGAPPRADADDAQVAGDVEDVGDADGAGDAPADDAPAGDDGRSATPLAGADGDAPSEDDAAEEDGGDAPPVENAGAAVAAATSEAAADPARDVPPAGAPVLGMPAEPHPLQIDWLRQRDFPGSDLVIEQELAPGGNYSRYIASYLSDGLKIYALLTIPQGERPESGWPVVVFNHGYIPPEQYRTTERYIAYTDAFSRNGYMLLRSDYRGHGSSEGEAEGGYGSPDYTVDVLNALASVRRHPDADPERIGMWGHSMGGHITLRSMVADPGIKAGVIWAGVVAPTERRMERWAARATERAAAGEAPSGWERRGRWRNDLVERFGTPEQNPDFWASLSANSYLDELSGPIQLHHGTADSSVPYDYSETLQRDLEAIGWPSELHTYPGDDHNIAANLGTALQRSVDFFDAHVKGG